MNSLIRLAATAALTALTLAPTASAQRMDRAVTSMILFDQLEYSPDSESLAWDAESWIGNQYRRFVLSATGEAHTTAREGEAEFEALYSHVITPYFNAQVGARFDTEFGGDGSNTAHLVVAMEGLAPYWFEIEPALFLSQTGTVSAEFTATYLTLVSQRAVLQWDLDLAAAAQRDEEEGLGRGLNSVELGARLRYEIRREFAPYVGISWSRLTGETADMAADLFGQSPSSTRLVLGIRFWK